MTSLTDRYVHAVTRQLPESQREDIAQELRGTIEDTIAASPEGLDPAEAERLALVGLGHPTKLADGYRGAGRSLVGPTYYPAWLRTVKMLLLVVPASVAAIMLVVGFVDGDNPGGVVGEAITSAMWATVMVLFWVTFGFVIAERTGDDKLLEVVDGGRGEWDPAKLPEPQKRQVSWGDSVVQIIMNLFLLVMLLLPARLGGSIDGTSWGQIFTDTAYGLRWVLAIGVAASLLSTIVVMVRGRWNWPAANINTIGNAIFAVPVIWLASQNNLFAWDTLPLQWFERDGNGLVVNEPATLWTTVLIVAAISLWDTVDGLWKASRTH